MTVRRIGSSWYVDVKFRHPTGRVERVRRRSPVQTRAGATRYELELRRALLDGMHRETPTLAAFAKDYLADCDATNRARTVREKAATLRRAVLPALGKLRLDAIGVRELDKYRAARVAAGRHPKTCNDEVALVVTMLRRAVEWGILPKAPRPKKLRVPPSEFDHLAFDEAAKLVAAGAEWAPMILLALRTGMRRGELRALRWQDVDLTAGRLVVNQAADDRGVITPPKNNRAREIPLSDDAIAALRSVPRSLDPSALVFGTITQRQMDRPLQRACRRAGLRAVGWHVLRHTFASQLVMRGAPLKAVQELLGHATLQMTMRYAHLSPDARRDAVQLLDGASTARGKKANDGL